MGIEICILHAYLWVLGILSVSTFTSVLADKDYDLNLLFFDRKWVGSGCLCISDETLLLVQTYDDNSVFPTLKKFLLGWFKKKLMEF